MNPNMETIIDFLTSSTIEAVRSILVGFGYQIYGHEGWIICGDVKMQISSFCSGIRSMRTMIGMTLLFSILNIKKTKLKYLLLALPVMMFISWIGNVLRCVSIFIVSLSNKEIGLGAFHDYFGYIVFGVELFILCLYFEIGKKDKQEGDET